MKYCIYLSIVLIVFLSCKQYKKNSKTEISNEMEVSKSKSELNKILTPNPDNIDFELYQGDVSNYDKEWEDNLPIGNLPFPLEEYSTVGNGLGKLIDTISKKQVAGNYIWVGGEETFFNILVQTDINEPWGHRSIASRNAPSYIGQGLIKNKIGNIDWIAFKTEDSEGYAIIGGRLFELKNGKTVFVYNYKNNGINFLQIDDNVKGKGNLYVDEYLQRIKNINEIKRILKE